MIPLALVTGFLGAGKTTFLRRLAARAPGRRLAFLINEISELDVDGARLSESAARVVSIPGGSIFCRCKAGEFLAEMRTLPERFSTPEAPLAGVVVEASGMADPSAIHQMLAESGLDKIYALGRVIALADPGRFLKLLAMLPNLAAQVRAADVVILNKADLYGETVLVAAEEAVRGLNAGAALLRARYAEVGVDPFAAVRRAGGNAQLAPCLDPHYATFAARFPAPARLPALAKALEALAPALLRAKGFVPTPNGWVYLDFSGGPPLVEPVSTAPSEADRKSVV